MERFSALVLSQDGDTLRAINRAFDEYGLETSVAHSIGDANELLKEQRFDLAVCDYDFPGASQFTYLDPANAWRGMVFALVRQGQHSQVRGQRVHLTLLKPLTAGLIARSLRAAYTTMAHERRAAFRHPVETEASWAELIDHGEQTRLGWARVVNISRTGMCLETEELLPQHALVRVAFELPQQGGLVNVEGEIVWAKSPGQSGLRFNHLPAVSHTRLTEWLEAKLPQEFALLNS